MEFMIASACLALQGRRRASSSRCPGRRWPAASSPARSSTAPTGCWTSSAPRSSPSTASARCTRSRRSSRPRYEPIHLAFRDEADLPRIGVALTRAYLPDATPAPAARGRALGARREASGAMSADRARTPTSCRARSAPRRARPATPCSTPGGASRTGRSPSRGPASSGSARSPSTRRRRRRRSTPPTRTGAPRRPPTGWPSGWPPSSPTTRRRARGSSPRPCSGPRTSSASTATPGSAELVRGVLGAGYPSPNRILRHVERVLEAYLVDMTGAEPGPPGRFRLFATEGGAAAMAYVFRTLQENRLLRRGDRIAIATPIFTPYLEIPLLEDFGFDVVELRSAHYADHRFDEHALDALRDPTDQGLLRGQPGQPGLPRHAHRAPGAAARPGAARPAGPAGHRGHRVRHVRRRLPEHPRRAAPQRDPRALVLEELRRHRQPPGFRRRRRRHGRRRAAGRAGRGRPRRGPPPVRLR